MKDFGKQSLFLLELELLSPKRADVFLSRSAKHVKSDNASPALSDWYMRSLEYSWSVCCGQSFCVVFFSLDYSKWPSCVLFVPTFAGGEGHIVMKKFWRRSVSRSYRPHQCWLLPGCTLRYVAQTLLSGLWIAERIPSGKIVLVISVAILVETLALLHQIIPVHQKISLKDIDQGHRNKLT